MRVRLADRNTHLGYCFNVLPGETVEALHEQTTRYCAPLRERLGWSQMGVGLWIANGAAEQLADDEAKRDSLRKQLDDHQLYVFTLNGFPYGGFHAARVKEKVFLPSWETAERLTYTTNLGRILAAMIPDDMAGSTISTVPLGPRGVDHEQVSKRLVDLVHALQQIHEDTGKKIEVCFEPEPGAGFERAGDLAGFLANIDREGYLSICFDTCHGAVVAEHPDHAWASFRDAGVGCGKIQISSALVVPDPSDPAQLELLASYDEPRFFHQVRGGFGAEAMDIPEAIDTLDRSVPWRVHFHVPIHRQQLDQFGTTAASIVPALKAAIANDGPLPHLEVETYTWNVLPEADRPTTDDALIDGLAAEMRWAADVIVRLKGELS